MFALNHLNFYAHFIHFCLTIFTQTPTHTHKHTHGLAQDKKRTIGWEKDNLARQIKIKFTLGHSTVDVVVQEYSKTIQRHTHTHTPKRGINAFYFIRSLAPHTATERKLFFIIIFVGILLLFYFIFFFPFFEKVFALISFIHDNWNDMKRVSVRIYSIYVLNGQFKPSRLYYSYKTFLLFSRFFLSFLSNLFFICMSNDPYNRQSFFCIIHASKLLFD